MQQVSIEYAFQVAGKHWKNKENPQRMTTKVKLTDDLENTEVNVVIYHHETFPSGGQSFTADLRKLPEAGQKATEGELIDRRRFHLI
jgi:hypothetical protein